MEVSKEERKRVLRAMRKMHATFFPRSFNDKRLNSLGKPKTGVAWVMWDVTIAAHIRPKPVHSDDAFEDHYEAAVDFLKWALVNL